MRLRKAFEGLAQRHGELRLAFHETPDGPVKRLADRTVDFAEVDAAGWDEARVRSHLQDEADRPFDLAQDALVRVRLLKTGGDDVILLVIHHLIADLGSLAILVRDLGPLYEGQSPPLLGRGTWEEREHRRIPPGGEGRHEAWWLDRLAGDLPVLDLPTDHPRPAARTFRGGSRTRVIELIQPRAKLFPVLLAAFDILLHRASGQTDLLVGSPTSGRLNPELAETIGYLVNPVVLRCDLSGSPTFRQLVERVRRTIFGALRHQDYPFARLVERLQPDRDLSRPPIFQVMLAFQRAHLEDTGDLAAFALGVAGARIKTGPLDLESIRLERHFSQLDLELMAAETSRGIELALTFNADLFEPETAERLLGHLETLLAAAAENPDCRIGELPLLTPAERGQLLALNRTAAPLPKRLVHELFEEQAARTPDAVAVSDSKGILTYRELSALSDRMAETLAPGPVPVRAERDASLLVALLAIWKAGAIYLPLNPDQPKTRTRRMLELSRTLPADPELAYLLFTSGSTGEPKGVMVHHRGLLNHLLAKIGDLDLSASDRVAQTAATSFDISLWQMLAPLLLGGRVEILSDAVVREPDRLLSEVESRGITVLELVPSVLGPFLDAMERPPARLRWMISTGEALPAELARRWISRTGVPLVNGYGPTECSDRVSHAFVTDHVSIGRPIRNLRLHVMTPDLEEQPIGFPGEICIGGLGVGRGYLNDPARTAAAFIPGPGERLYRTGDLGRRRADGEIEILGRLDHQIKLRGVRIEPGEIEAALRSHPGVRDAVVALRGNRLVAWWTGDPLAALREHLKDRLPESMIPAAFRHLEALPLNANGKVDRRALPDPEIIPTTEAPGDGLEAFLAEIVGSVLGRSIGPRDNFFDLGGHSLLAAQVVARLRSSLAIDPPAGLLFEEPTLAGLTRRVRDLQRTAAGLPITPPIVPVFRNRRIPLSFAQERLWFLHRLDPGSPAYNMPGLVRIDDPARIEAALSGIVARHESLRTTFPEIDGEPYQHIAPPAPVRLPIIDLSALPDPEREMREVVEREARRPFDLDQGPLLRLIRFDNHLFANLHHSIADGWSQEILLRELRGGSLPPLPVQYADFAVWERNQNGALAAQLDWWKRELSGGLPPLDLPLDRPRPPRQRHRGAVLPVRIPAVRHPGATPFMVLLAAFQALLHRLTGQDDIRVGAPVANRQRTETENLIGLFANTVVLRTRFDSRPLSLSGLIERVKRTVLGVFPHQDLPFGRLVEELQPARDPSRTPLFQAMLAVQPSLSVEEIGTGTAKLELTLSIRPGEGRGWIEYDTDLFDCTTVARWAASFSNLLAADPETPVADLPLLREEEQTQILIEWNDTAATVPDIKVHHLFEAQARKTPDAVAVTAGDQSLTYQELNARADDFARGREPGIGYALHADRSIDMLVSLLGILKAEAFYVPLDPSYPEQRLQWMMEAVGSQGEGLAYTLFTSGSTGRPKGVQVPHRALVNFLLSMAERPGLKSNDILLAVTTLSFDIAALELLLPLIVGAQVVIADRETAADGARLATEIERVGATVLQATPATWRMLIDSGWTGSPNLTALCGGETLPRELARDLLERTAAVWNLYGPTETTVWSVIHRVEDAERPIPIGRPIANTSIYLVDRNFQLVPLGVPGELLIGGAGIAQGYFDRQDLTAERFLPGPDGGRLYRTGDLARRLADGNLEILGRIDHQVKVRGFRIELEEVEAALASCPGVSRAVAAVRDGSLVAWVVGQHPGPELARRLPAFMIPSRISVVDALPLTPNGKVDRRALPDPEPIAIVGEAPSSPIEVGVAEIWRRVLEIDLETGVGRDQSFFELGGHSVLAARVISRINESFGIQLPLRAMFESPTVASLAKLLDGERHLTNPIPKVPRGRPLNPSFAQERLWVMDRLSPGNPVYNVSQAIDLEGLLDEAALERAFAEVVRRHEVLRTRFETVQGKPVQVVEPESFRLPIVDLRGVSDEADRLALEDARRPFDLRRGPLLRATLLRLGDQSRRLLLAVHHIVCDDASLAVLVREVEAVYRGESLPDLAVQYADWAEWQRRRVEEIQDAELVFWKGKLGSELPVLSLPTDRPRPAVQTFRGATLPIHVPASLTESLRDLSLRHGTTLFMTLLAAFASALQRASGQDDLVIGTPVAGRDRTEIEGLVGLFVNVLPLRLDLAGSPSWSDRLARVRSAVLEAFEHQVLPFEKLVEILQPKRDLGRAALRQAGFSFQDARLPAGLPGIQVRPVPVDPGVSRLDFTLFLAPQEEGLGGFLEYSTDLFDPATAARLADGFRQALDDLAGDELGRAPGTNLTEGQLLFWFAHRLHPDVQLYFDRATATFTIDGDLDPIAFSRAFDKLLENCDVLRSRVREVSGMPWRSLAEPAPFAMEVFELETSPPGPLSHLPPTPRRERGNAAEAMDQDLGDIAPDTSPLSPRERGTGGEVSLGTWLTERAARPMNLGDRLFDTALLRLAPSRWIWYLSIHHLIADAWTLELLARRLSELYKSGDAPRFPSYDDYVAAERAERMSEKGRRAREYWERKLSRPAPQNPFYGRPGTPSTTETVRLSAELGPEPRATAAALGFFSPSVIFATALFALLHRLSGERRLRIGTPFANRPERFRGTPGLMMNAVPLEVEIDPGETFATLARKVQRESVEVARHQSHPVRNPEDARVYDVYFNYQSVAFRELCGLPVRFELLHSGRSLDRLDLQVSDFGGEGRFRLDLDFNVESFGADERERTLGHLLNLLHAFTANPDQALSDAPLLTPAEQDLLARFNDTARSYPRGLWLHDLFRKDDAVAVTSEAGALTYRELDEESDRLASWLRSRNARLVGIRLERSLELMVALVGTLKAGAAYVPLDPGYPADRLALMAEDSGATVILDGAIPSGIPDDARPIDEADLAYVIYTSGSTGRPKGVMIPHAGIVNRLLWMQETYGLMPDDRVLQKTPISFDVSVWELFWPLIAGARLIMARPGGHQDPAYLVSVIVRESITTIHFVPSMLQVFLEQPGVERCRSLRRVICSGEALPEALRRRFHERLPGVELHNLYGPTEASVDVTAWASDPSTQLDSVPIGKPIANTQIHILGPHLTPVPPGIPGELCIGGISLARGYHNRLDLTAERFVPAPGGERLYRTGDLARWLADGNIEYLGRIDHQVKIRGVRIELGEVEAHLASFPGVRETVATVRDGRLVGYYVPEPGWGPSPDQLRGWLRTRLPEVMVPSAFVALESMPLTPSGKADRRNLPEPESTRPTVPAAPRTPLQSLVAGVCAEVLGVEDVPLDVSFFDLGGNSLMATQVVTLLQEVLPVELDLRKVFEGPTVARLATVIEEERSALPEPERLAMAEILAELERSMAEMQQER
ncbi:MAG TPA: amino acid adenylation domain-containing protein [Thermoanaerobaculia bacterium]|nr:amino acid adenylation domain-containing protein [Thermoanaerobaculia bacterium]